MSATITKQSDTHHVGKSPDSKYVVEILRDVCIGAGSCAAIAPETFKLDDENLAYFGEEWDADDLILAAAQSCPVFAIIIKDAQTGEQIFPEPE